MKHNPTAQILDREMEERRFRAEIDRLDRHDRIPHHRDRRIRMAILKMEGRTHDMLAKDKRVAEIRPIGSDSILIALNPEWQSGGNRGHTFSDWESARNWVRKAMLAE